MSTQPGSTDLVLQGNHCSLHRGEHALQLQLHWEIKLSQEIQESVSFHGTASFDVMRALKQQQHLLFWRSYWGRRGSPCPTSVFKDWWRSVPEDCHFTAGVSALPLVIPLLMISVHLRNCELGEADPGACEEAYVCPWPVVVGI